MQGGFHARILRSRIEVDQKDKGMIMNYQVPMHNVLGPFLG